MELIHFNKMASKGVGMSKHVPKILTQEIREIQTNYVKPNNQNNRHVCKFNIPKFGHTVKLNSFVFNSLKISTVEDFKDKMQAGYLMVEIDSQGNNSMAIMQCDFSIMMELAEVIKYDCNDHINTIYSYTVDFPSYVLDEIIITALQHHSLYITMVIPNAHLIEQTRMFVEYTYHDEQQKQTLTTVAHEKVIQQITLLKTHIWESDEQTTISSNLDAMAVTKGFFIEGDITKIKQLTIKLVGTLVIEYDNFMLRKFCYKISNNLHYLSYTNKNNYKDMSIDSYIGGINHSSYEVKLTLVLNPSYKVGKQPSHSAIRFYSVSLNFLRYMAGMAGIVYYINTTAPPDNVVWPVKKNNFVKFDKLANVLEKKSRENDELIELLCLSADDKIIFENFNDDCNNEIFYIPTKLAI